MTILLPEVEFIETDTQKIIESVIQPYEELTGRKLAEADPVRLLLLSYASVIVQLSVKINDAARQNLLYYSRGDVLDHKGYPWDTPRLGNDKATTYMRFLMAMQLETSKIIPQGSLVTADGELFFSTTREVVIAPGELYADAEVECTTPGEIGNGYQIGEIDTLVTPLSFLQSVKNLTVSEGGTKRESDENYRERIHEAPEKLSVAGPTGAYEFHAKSASAAISDVYIHSPTPGCVDVKVLLHGGGLPGEEIIAAVSEKLNDRKVRPLTDYVTVGAPDVIEYEIDMTYYIEREAADKSLIQAAVEKAISEYKSWQQLRIGRDINPSKLIANCMEAGAKRVEVRSPVFTKITEAQVAQVANESIIFGGVEDD